MRHRQIEQVAPEAAQRARRVRDDVASDVLADVLVSERRARRFPVDLAERARHQHTVRSRIVVVACSDLLRELRSIEQRQRERSGRKFHVHVHGAAPYKQIAGRVAATKRKWLAFSPRKHARRAESNKGPRWSFQFAMTDKPAVS